jgi:cobalamin synthase
MRPLQELRAAAGLLASSTTPPRDAAAGLAWLPLVGAATGGAAAVAGAAIGALHETAGAIAAVAVLAACSWRIRRATLGPAVPLAAVVLEAAAAAVMPPSARALALVIAPVLACWAIVVQCYGGVPAERRDAWSAVVGRARFREFGWASVAALGCALVALDAVGLVATMLAAGATLAVRAWAYRARGGMSARHVVATGLVVEAAVLCALAAIARITA